MKGGIYDGKTDTHTMITQDQVRENTMHSWHDEGAADVHPFDRTTRPVQNNDTDFEGKYNWSTAVLHSEFGRLEASPFARQLVAGGKHGEPWQHYDGF